ncbi:MAG TPA: peptidylprolyl isomerase [Polyangiaceae bacterium]
MQRWTTVVVGAFLVVVIGALVWKGGTGRLLAAPSDAGREASAESASLEGGILEDPAFAALLDNDAGLPSAFAEPSEGDSGAGLPSASPKTVRFGVILVHYRGAQQAPASARSKDEAMTLARSLAESARGDFKSQVAKGDPGSTEDAGHIHRGVLEPAAEYTLFTMTPGAVSEPIDTPRGFWIVKRLE